MNRETTQTLFAVLIGWVVVFACVTLFRPLMPVDETRYMTVAWEMLVRDAWLLPTLNYDPYSHKPPLLFWLIRGAWEIFGVGEAPVRATLGVFIFALFVLTARLAKTLLPDDTRLPSRSVLMLAALPLFLIYASMIMFDSLLSVFVLCGLLCVAAAARRGGILPWIGLGASIGLGILAKGPVMLVYTLPVALLAPLWISGRAINWKRWYGGVVMAIILGAGIALCWAVPAAILGGDAYAQKIFLKQSAGRMVNAFDHQQPFWFYGPVVFSFLAPVFLWPALWRQARALKVALMPQDAATKEAVRFLLCQIVPAFVFFSVISSKQIHYMIPILPAVAIVIAVMIGRISDKWPAGIPIILTSLPSLILLCDYWSAQVTHITIAHWDHIMDGFMPWVAMLHVALALGIGYFTEHRPEHGVRAMALSAFLLFAFAHIQLGQSFFPRYDLTPLRWTMAQYEDRPIAVAPKYDGEYGYVLRLKKHVDLVEGTTMDAWVSKHPDGLVVIRGDYETDLSLYYTVYHSMMYRFDKRVAIIGYNDKKHPHWLK